MGTPAAPTKTMDGVLTNSAGMTLYTFDKDATGSGKSVCNGPCATNWPPLMAAADSKASGDYTIITRDDGGKQWAYKGKPLYLWVKDSQARRQDRRRLQQRMARRAAVGARERRLDGGGVRCGGARGGRAAIASLRAGADRDARGR